MNTDKANPTSVHHLVRAVDWNAASGAPYSPASLSDEGFIHFSTSEQVPHTSRRYYADVADLLLVTVDASQLDSELRWEDLAGHGEFPHLYGALNRDAVTDVRPYMAGEQISAGLRA